MSGSKPAPVTSRASKKLEAAIEYLRDNPEKAELSGRQLETENNLGISYKTWNKAKK